jgi:hypothetical protein
VLADFELFIVTWILAGVELTSLLGVIYSSYRIWLHRMSLQITDQRFPKNLKLTKEAAVRLRCISKLLLILSCIAGAIISTINWIPPGEYNYDTVLLRVFSILLDYFLILPLIGGLFVYFFSGEAKKS